MDNHVRKFRESQGLTQAALATDVGVSRQTIVSIETGKFQPSLSLAFSLAERLSTPITELFIPENPKETP